MENSKEDEIEALSKRLLQLLSETENKPEQQLLNSTPSKVGNDATEVENKLRERLGVEVSVVRKIMKRVDEVYGRKHSNIITDPLYDSLPD